MASLTYVLYLRLELAPAFHRLHLHVVFQRLEVFFPAADFELLWSAKVKQIGRSLGLQNKIQLLLVL